MLIHGDARRLPLKDESVNCCVTSPPYWGLRDYGIPGQLGLEHTPEEYVAAMVEVFRGVRRVLRQDGTAWVNMGDSYNAYNGNAGPGSGFSSGAACDTQRPHLESGHGLRTSGLKPKDLVGIPWRVAFALQADGWWLRSDIVWSKPNPMPESVTDRPTKSHEYVFLMAKSERYYFDQEAVREPDGGKPSGNGYVRPERIKWEGRGNPEQFIPGAGRNIRSVWTIPTQPYAGAHYATFPEALVKRCILAGCPPGGIVLDPFVGSGTTVRVARSLGRKGIGVDLSAKYLTEQATSRVRVTQGLPL